MSRLGVTFLGTCVAEGMEEITLAKEQVRGDERGRLRSDDL